MGVDVDVYGGGVGYRCVWVCGFLGVCDVQECVSVCVCVCVCVQL